jgi:conjugal transfer mating pair stabilization protein TraG
MTRRVRKVTRWLQKRPAVFWIGLVFAAALIAYTIGSMNQRLQVDPVSAKPLLDLIARVESKGNYNAYFGNAGNTSITFTEMSIADVLSWQEEFIAAGHPSSAVGRYQIISTTLKSLVQQLDIDINQPFNETMQDKMAVALLERRGAAEYVNNQIDGRQFAAELAKEWAALPKIIGDRPEQSYYAGDGLNKALVGVDEILRAVNAVSAKMKV